MTEEQKHDLQRTRSPSTWPPRTARIITCFKQMCAEIERTVGFGPMVDPTTRQKVGHSNLDEVILEQIEAFGDQVRARELKLGQAGLTGARRRLKVSGPVSGLGSRSCIEERDRKSAQMKRGDELPAGVLEMVKVYVATKRTIAVGDKMAGPTRQQGRDRTHRPPGGHALPGRRHAAWPFCSIRWACLRV